MVGRCIRHFIWREQICSRGKCGIIFRRRYKLFSFVNLNSLLNLTCIPILIFQLRYSNFGIPSSVFHLRYFIFGVPTSVFHSISGVPISAFQLRYANFGISFLVFQLTNLSEQCKS